MRYRFLDQDDERLLALADMPAEEGIAIAVEATGFTRDDEAVELVIADLEGKPLFHQRVRPQNAEGVSEGQALSGDGPDEGREVPELYQFEEEIHRLFEGAAAVVAPHLDFTIGAIEAGWVTLPPFKGFDLVKVFCECHSTGDYPDEPAATASLEGIADYYDVDLGEGSLEERARAAALCYRAMVRECVDERQAKGEAYWHAYEQRKEEARKADKQVQAQQRTRDIKGLRINAVLWLCAAAIFSNLAVQLGIRSFDGGIVVLVGAAAVFFAIRWVQCLYKMYKLSRQR